MNTRGPLMLVCVHMGTLCNALFAWIHFELKQTQSLSHSDYW